MKRVVKSLVCFVLVGVMFVGSLIGTMSASSVTVYADSNDRIKAFIKLAADSSNIDESLDGLTEDELRFLGIFLSNYYIPFGTEFGSSSNNNATTDSVKDNMVDVLKSSIGYSDDLAKSFVEIIFSYIRGSQTDLNFYVKDDDSDKYIQVPFLEANYANFFRIMCGRTDGVLNAMFGNNWNWQKGEKEDLPKIGDVDFNVKDEGNKIGRYGVFGEVDYLKTVDDIPKLMSNNDNRAIKNLNYLAMAIYEKKYDDDGSSYTKIGPDDGKSYGSESTKNPFGKLSKTEAENILLLYQLKCGRYKKLYLGFKGTDNIVHPVFDAYVGKKFKSYFRPVECETSADIPFTASQKAFIKSLESTDFLHGFGLSFFDTSVDEANKLVSNHDNQVELLGALSSDDLYSMSIMGAMMRVDCFGDILYIGQNHQLVAVPAAINPYIWQSVDSDGNDIYETGSVFNICNSISLNQIENSNLFSTANKLDKTENSGIYQADFGFTVFNDYCTYIANHWKNGSNYGHPAVPIYRGDNRTDFSEKNFFQSIFTTWGNSDNWDGNKWLCQSAIVGYYYHLGLTKNNRALGYLLDDDHAKVGTFDVNTSDEGVGFGATSQWLDKSNSMYGISFPANHNDEFKDSKELGIGGAGYTLVSTNIVFINNLGTYKDQDGDAIKYEAFAVESFIDENGKFESSYDTIKASKLQSGNILERVESGQILSDSSTLSSQAACSLYVTYCFACLYNDSTKSKTIARLGFRLNKHGLPLMSNSAVSMDSLSDILGDLENEDIKHWTYYLLHPTSGFQYVVTLIRNKVNHVLLGWHYDMTGTNGVGINTGTTKYRSTMGYVTMPDLSEIEWTNSLIDFYEDCIPFLIILLIIIMVFAFVTKAVGAQQAIVGVLLFSIFTLLPVNLINATVQESNRLTQNIYGQKFTYWALVQQESYAKAIDEAANEEGSSGSSSYGNYLRTLYATNSSVYSNQGSDSILLKWQAPKKMASLVLSQDDGDALSDLSSSGRHMLSGMLNNAYGGQTFLDDDDANYLYRSYTDISNFSRYIYRGISNSKDSLRVAHTSVLGGSSKSSKTYTGSLEFNNNYYDYWNTIDLTYFGANRSTAFSDMYKQYVEDGYTNGSNFKVSGDSYTESDRLEDTFYMTVPLSSSFINDLFKEYSDSTKKISSYSNSDNLVPINQDVFNFGIPMFNGGLSTEGNSPFDVENLIATGGFSGNDSVDVKRQENLREYVEGYKETDYTGLAAYGLYSENPYYYFSWKLYSDGMNCDSSLSEKNFKDMLLDRDNGGYFYNTKGNGELKDFMNMKGLFCTIIPYMKQCNDYVREWDDVFGVFTYDGVPTEEGHWDEVKDDPELAPKYWHNLNVARLYMIYCPWVDVMYDCSYAKAETITVLGKSVTIEDPINPYSYPKDRPMIFSRSEMIDYGLGEGDLTKVEKLILSCNDQFQDRLYELLNYYTFSDVSLNSAAAINCAFVFNNTFSESGIFTDNHNIYPQAFDIANFSYDAFLRLALANGTGENLLSGESTSGTYAGTTTGDFYERVVNNSSVLTVIIMLILDIVSIYVIPAIRMFFLIALFVAVILLTLVAALKIEENMKFVRKMLSRFFLPLLLFFVTTIAFSFLLSFFMGSPANSVTQTSNFNISLGDPVMTMLAMLVMNILLIIIYWKIIKGVLKDLKERAGQLKSFGAGLGSAAVGFVGGLATAGVSGVHKVRNEFGEFSRDMRSRKDSKNLQKTAENSPGGGKDAAEKPAQNGTGVENGRANSRGSNNRASSAEMRSSGRDKDSMTERPSVPEENQRARNDALTRRSDIDAKAKEGSENLKNSYNKKKSKYLGKQLGRKSNFDETIDKKYGYARNENTGDIDTSKLTRRDKKGYTRRVDKFVGSEAKKMTKENKKLFNMVKRDRESTAMEAKKKFKVIKRSKK